MTRRGDDIPRPNPWRVRAADRTAGVGWDQLVANQPDAADRAWVAMTSNPRRTDDRQHQLKGALAHTTVGGRALDHWQIEATSGGRIWYAIDDNARVLWITHAGTAHPKQTETRRRRKR